MNRELHENTAWEVLSRNGFKHDAFKSRRGWSVNDIWVDLIIYVGTTLFLVGAVVVFIVLMFLGGGN